MLKPHSGPRHPGHMPRLKSNDMGYPGYRSFRRALRRHFFAKVSLLLLVLFCVAVVVIYQTEKRAKPDQTLFDSFTTVLVFFLGEYGDTPATMPAKILSIVLFVLGIGVVAAIIGKFASLFVELKREVKMPKELEQHIVMCNWSSRGDRIIREIHSPLASPQTEIVIISDSEVNEAELRQQAEYEKVFFVRSDPTLHGVLKRARAHLAKSVIILADPEHSDPDAKTALIALAITKLERELPQKPRIIAEVMNHHKIQHLLDAGVDEWVCSADYGLGIIAQSALFGKLSEVYQQLLTYSKETNEIYLVRSDKYPQEFVGKTFAELAEAFNSKRVSHDPIILLGIKRNDQIILNPRAQQFDRLKEDDSLIVMSFDQPDLTQ